MCDALRYADHAIEQWIYRHPNSFPPAVINTNDGDREPVAQEIMDLQTSDGNVLMCNCRLSEVPAMPIQYPDMEGLLPDGYAGQLFRMLSIMPQSIRNKATTLDTRSAISPAAMSTMPTWYRWPCSLISELAARPSTDPQLEPISGRDPCSVQSLPPR